jgi:3-dehydroquinate dehydratase-2
MSHLNILVLHGPNLNLLGTREPETYGAETLQDINHQLNKLADELGASITTEQSNHEGELVEHIQHAKQQNIAGIIINPAAYTHTSVALRDALLAVNIPFVETHLSNVHQRENFRQKSFLADAAIGVIAGFGSTSYTLALRGLIKHLENKES